MSTSHRRALAAAAAAVLLAAGASIALAQGDAAVVDHGHVDMVAPAVVDGALVLRYKDGSVNPPVWRDPDQVVTHVKPAAQTQVPPLPEYAFLGPAGSDLWMIPETENPDLVWAGWNTESLTAEQVAPDSVRWTLNSVGGNLPGSAAPGAVTVFHAGPFGEPSPRVFDTAQPLPQSHMLALDTHAHANWTFSAEGVYRLSFTIEATTPAGAPLRDTAVYTVAVGAVDPGTVPPGTGPAPTSTASTTAPTGGTGSTTDPTGSTTSAPSATTRPPQSCVVLDNGHVDLVAPQLRDGTLDTRIKDGTAGSANAVWRNPADVVVHVVPAARNTIPDFPAYRFLGTPGQPVWIIPQTEIPGVIWAGWNTEALPVDQLRGDVTLTLSAVEGPAPVAVFLAGPEPTILLDSADGLPDALTVAPGTHAHANWAFRGEGTYRLTMTTTATLTDGRTVSDTDVYTIAVGNVDPTSALGRNCTPPSQTSTSPTVTSTATTATTTAVATTTAGQPPSTSRAQAHTRLADTGAGGVGSALLAAGLLLAGGVIVLLLLRRRA